MNTITPLSIYLFGLLDKINTFCVVGIIVALGLSVPFIVTAGVENDWLPIKKYWKIYVSVLSTLVLTATFLPSSKTYAAMVILPQIAQSDVIKKDVPEMYEAAKNLLLDNTKKAEK